MCGWNYDPYPCSDFADQGDWVGGLPADYTWLIPPAIRNGGNVDLGGGGGPPSVRTGSTSSTTPGSTKGDLYISLRATPDKINDNPNPWYFTKSPDDGGNVFYVSATRNTCGQTAYTCCSEHDPNAPGQLIHWGRTALLDQPSVCAFIGVINE